MTITPLPERHPHRLHSASAGPTPQPIDTFVHGLLSRKSGELTMTWDMSYAEPRRDVMYDEFSEVFHRRARRP